MINRIGRAFKVLFGSDTTPVRLSEPRGESGGRPVFPQSPERLRRWDSAQTHRLNSAHWAGALSAQHINQDIASHLETVAARCVYEASNNPFVEGVINTHSLDLITPSGPTIHITSDNPGFNALVKSEFLKWWESPEIGGEITGPELLRRWNRQLWTRGDDIAIFDTEPSAGPNEVSFRLFDIDPQRLRTPYDRAGEESVAMGIRRSKKGKPLSYFIDNENQNSVFSIYSGKTTEHVADDVLHYFHATEPGQVRGVPLLSCCLEEIAQLRDYDIEVMDAARAAANNGALATNDNPENFSGTLPTSSITFERGKVKWLEPGWKLSQMQPHQPIANYNEFRHEKLRALGRPAHMPLLLILLSAEESNFSQSRIDVNVFYERGLRTERFSIETRILNRIFRRWWREFRLLRRGGKFVYEMEPAKWRANWQWEPMPPADEEKAMKAKALKRSLALSTPSSDNNEIGQDFSEVLAQLSQDEQAIAAAGVSVSAIPEQSQSNASNQAETETASQASV